MLQLLLASLRYGESYQDKLPWWERRLMDAIPILVLVVIVFLTGALWGLISRIVKKRRIKH